MTMRMYRPGKLKPMFPELNAVVLEMARPIQYTLTRESYADFAEMKMDAVQRGGKFSVNTIHSERTIFGYPEVNWAFRAWHDACHLEADADFSEAGEQAATDLMLHQLDMKMGLDYPLIWTDIINIEVMGQFHHLKHTGLFPVDQRIFMVEELRKRGWNQLGLWA